MKKLLLPMLALAPVAVVPSAQAAAGLFVEPMVTYESGSGDINYPDPISDSDADTKGWGAGARLGFHILDTVFIGADGRYSMPRFEESGLDIKADARAWNWGPTAGVQLPFPFTPRIWGTYILDAELDPEKDNGVNTKFTQGSGWRVGAGMKLAFVSLNLEWQKIEYDRSKAKTSIADFNSSKIDLDNSALVFSVSFPIGL